MLSSEKGFQYDADGNLAAQGKVNPDLLNRLNRLEYYTLAYPKALANSFGTDIVFPVIKEFQLSVEDALATYVEHISMQVKNSLMPFFDNGKMQSLMITGGGAFNKFLIKKMAEYLSEINFEISIPEDEVVNYKEALIMALLGTLRWREQYTVLSSVTGASRNSIGGALWLGGDA